jgi:hypothetical protein
MSRCINRSADKRASESQNDFALFCALNALDAGRLWLAAAVRPVHLVEVVHCLNASKSSSHTAMKCSIVDAARAYNDIVSCRRSGIQIGSQVLAACSACLLGCLNKGG